MGPIRNAFSALILAGATVLAQDPLQPATPPPTIAPELDPALQPEPQLDPAAAPAPVAAPASAPAKPKKPAAPKIPSVRGTVAKLDNVGMTIAVDVKGKEQVFKISSRTRIFADAKPAIFMDGKRGENVVVEYQTAKDKSREAVAVRFGSLTAKKP